MSDPWTTRRSEWPQQPDDVRAPADVDYGRIIHAASFRRLQDKTQILPPGEHDFYRTRLTHTLEVAQIASGLSQQLGATAEPDIAIHLPDRTQIQSSALCHDLGHPPFGHSGEIALNYAMRDHGGFEGNGQSLRIIARLDKMSRECGADLTRRTMLGMLKYPCSYSELRNPSLIPGLIDGPSIVSLLDEAHCTPPKCYFDSETDVMDWITQPFSDDDTTLFRSSTPREGKHAKARFKSLDCSIMDVADDIAYGIHDMEDALAMRLLKREDFLEICTPDRCEGLLQWLQESSDSFTSNSAYETVVERLFSAEPKHMINKINGYLIPSIRIAENPEFEHPFLRYNAVLEPEAAKVLDAFKALVRSKVIESPVVNQLRVKGQRMLIEVFEVMASAPEKYLPRTTHSRFVAADDDMRVLCDHVAGMTDGFFVRTYERMFSPRMGSFLELV